MGCVYSYHTLGVKENYELAPSSSQDFRASSNDSSQELPRSTLSLDPAAIEMEVTDNEGESGPATPLKSEATVPVKVVEKKQPSSPFIPNYLLEGRSFLQSPLGKKKVPLREFCDSPTRNRLSGKFNDMDTVKTRIFRD